MMSTDYRYKYTQVKKVRFNWDRAILTVDRIGLYHLGKCTKMNLIPANR
jgi:hypothetical protein